MTQIPCHKINNVPQEAYIIGLDRIKWYSKRLSEKILLCIWSRKRITRDLNICTERGYEFQNCGLYVIAQCYVCLKTCFDILQDAMIILFYAYGPEILISLIASIFIT